MLSGVAEFVIQGVTTEGKVFQPGSWAVGLCNMMATVGGDGRILYSSYARPVMVDGVPAVVVRVSLQKVDPVAFAMVQNFIAENCLKVRAGRGSRDAESTGPHPVLGMERRKSQPEGW